MSNKAERGDAVTLNYEGKIEDGSTFHTFEQDPIMVELGSGTLVKGLEAELIGMAEGEEKVFRVMPEDGYGAEKPELYQTIDSDLFAETDIAPSIGMVLKTPHGNCHITKIEDGRVEISYNHPLAGKVLDYRVKVLRIAKK